MISFASFMLGKFLNPLTGHSLLANAGVFAVALGIVAGLVSPCGFGYHLSVSLESSVAILGSGNRHR